MNARSLCGALALLLAPPAYAGKQGPNTGGGSISYSTRGYATEAEAHRAEQREAGALQSSRLSVFVVFAMPLYINRQPTCSRACAWVTWSSAVPRAREPGR